MSTVTNWGLVKEIIDNNGECSGDLPVLKVYSYQAFNLKTVWKLIYIPSQEREMFSSSYVCDPVLIFERKG